MKPKTNHAEFDNGGKMRRPKDVDDLSQCVAVRDGWPWVWCVECHGWHSTEVTGMARVRVRHGRVLAAHLEESFECLCSACGAVVDYLLNGEHRNAIARKVMRGGRE